MMSGCRALACVIIASLLVYSAEAGVRTDVAVEFSNSTCVCVFDFDGTMHTGDHEQAFAIFLGMADADDLDRAAEMGAAVDACREAGYRVAIASRNCNDEVLTEFLKDTETELPTPFTDEFFESDAFQICQVFGTKAGQLEMVTEFYDAEPQCAVLFDDDTDNLQGASDAGTQFVHVEPEVGVTLQDVADGMTLVEDLGGCSCS